ncbi:hypothetical protein [Pedobacter chinensis]|nr:hypothetical protein [Pedobacter chinensis]
MAKRNKQTNPIKNWIDNDSILTSVLVEIQNMNISIEEQAEAAFHKLCEMYRLPKMPANINEYDEDELESEDTSVYQELGLLKFLEPNDDLRGLVLVAVYNTLNKITINLDEVYRKAGVSIHALICYKGENSRVNISFLSDSESWFDSECVMCLKGE